MKIVNIIKVFSSFIRTGMLFGTLSIILIAVLGFQHEATAVDIIWYLAIGLSCHIFGFVLNDLIDWKIDIKNEKRVSYYPYDIKKYRILAYVIALMQVPIILAIVVFVYNNITGFIIAFLSITFSVVYNMFSKQTNINKLFVEISLALSIAFMYCLIVFLNEKQMTQANYITSLLIFLVLFQLNSIPSGLKDIYYDFNQNLRSFVIQNGCIPLDRTNVLISRKIQILLLSLSILIIAFSILLLIIAANTLVSIMLIASINFLGLYFNIKFLKSSKINYNVHRMFLGAYIHYLSIFIISILS